MINVSVIVLFSLVQEWTVLIN